jgi:3-oxoacyl-[acyl-carrier protein] reductase
MTGGRLAGKIAIITGAGSGIGLAAVELFAAEGARVFAVDRKLDGLADFHANPDIACLAADLALDEAPATILDAAFERFGGIDILYNNAGILENQLAETTLDTNWDRTFAVNVRATFRLVRQAIPLLRKRAAERGRARIINTASVMAQGTDIGLAAYTASKHAVAGLTKTLALELGKFGITANYLLPGAIDTPMNSAFADPAIRAVWARKAAVRRLGAAADIARAALLLAQDEADFITGHGLVVDGGLMLRV